MTTTPTTTIKLLDINYDCLERIFRHLDPADLINITYTNRARRKELKSIAERAFRHKFGRREFFLSDNSIYYYSSGIAIDDLHVLYYFGHLITKLDIQGHEELVTIANEYCFDSLTSIKLSGVHIRSNNLLQKSFTRVEFVELYDCTLYEHIDFQEWFPAVRHLQLNWCYVDGMMFGVGNLPNLEHLAIKDDSAVDVCSSLVNNPQLRSLSFEMTNLPRDFWNKCQTLSAHLESLQIHSDVNFKQNLGGNNTIQFPVLKRLDIYLSQDDQRLLTSDENIISFGQLEDVTLHPVWLPLVAAVTPYKWSNFFHRNQTIERVTMWCICCERYSIHATIMNDIIKELPLLREFNYLGFRFSVDQIISFIHKTNLMSYSFYLSYDSEFDDLKMGLGAGWHASRDGQLMRVSREL